MVRMHAHRRGIADFMLLLLVVGLIAFVIIFWQYFYFLFRVITIKGNINVFMSNDDAGTELVGLLAAKNSSVSHMERLGIYTAEGIEEGKDDRIIPFKDTLQTAFPNYDFTFNGAGTSINFKKGVFPAIQDETKSAIVGCGTTTSQPIILKWPLPTTSKYINSGFGGRDLSKEFGLTGCDCHGGIDIKSDKEDVHPAAAGMISDIKGGCTRIAKDCNSGYGNYVVISHESGKYYTHYNHLDSLNPSLKKGDKVDENTVLGKSGNTGVSSGPHLHFEVRIGNDKSDVESVNPCGLFTNIKSTDMTGSPCTHQKVSVCTYVAGTGVRSYETNIPLPGPFSGAKLENLRGTVILKQWD